MRNHVLVTGLGPISSIGSGVPALWEALCMGRHGFGPVTRWEVGAFPARIAAEVRDFRIADYLSGTKRWALQPRYLQFAMAAATLALRDAGVEAGSVDPERVGVVVGSSVSSIQEILDQIGTTPDDEAIDPRAAFSLFSHSAACHISAYFDLRGPASTVGTGCNAGMDAVGQAAGLIQAGVADAMLVIGSDCEVTPVTMRALNAANALTRRYNNAPGRASRPFDKDRDGNVIGEGAAAVFLESEAHAEARRARPYARWAGYSTCASGKSRVYNHLRPDLDPAPALRVLRAALQQAHHAPQDISAVNANGSSSVLYDRLESQALDTLLGPKLEDTPVHSIKSMLGQHGAGSSALQVVSACLSLRHGVLPPTINYETPDPTCAPLPVVTRRTDGALNSILVHAIGFGGFYYSASVLQRV